MGTGLDYSPMAGAERKTKRSFDVAFLTGSEVSDSKRQLLYPSSSTVIHPSSPIHSSDSNSASPEPAAPVGGDLGAYARSAFTKVIREDPRLAMSATSATPPWNIPLLTTAQPFNKQFPSSPPEFTPNSQDPSMFTQFPSVPKDLPSPPGQISPPFSLYFYDWLTQIQARTGDASNILPLANPYLNIPDLGKGTKKQMDPRFHFGREELAKQSKGKQSANPMAGMQIPNGVPPGMPQAYSHPLAPSFGPSKTPGFGSTNLPFMNPMAGMTGAAAALTLPASIPFSLTLPAQNTCASCSLTFRMTSDLVYHMRTHHKRAQEPDKLRRGEKLKCPICKEKFRERHHLTRHMTAHEDKKEEASEVPKEQLEKSMAS